mmetsp:Transcript_13269/g.27850  ORF Transcript_13269/g.27850 Transcript_13269/m.27850 type:complete len:124 (-) Transcript_13269:2073-2444(-)
MRFAAAFRTLTGFLAYGSVTTNGGISTQMTKLVADDSTAVDYFGWSVAISGNTAVVGARGDDDKGPDTGSAYVFNHNGTGWGQTAKLLAVDGASNQQFGNSVAIGGNIAVVGAHGDGGYSGSA